VGQETPTDYLIQKAWYGGKSVLYNCPTCGVNLESAFKEAGNKETCPHCHAFFLVPGGIEKQAIQDAKKAKEARQRIRNSRRRRRNRIELPCKPSSTPSTPLRYARRNTP